MLVRAYGLELRTYSEVGALSNPVADARHDGSITLPAQEEIYPMNNLSSPLLLKPSAYLAPVLARSHDCAGILLLQQNSHLALAKPGYLLAC